jgi:mRNA interferase HigB
MQRVHVISNRKIRDYVAAGHADAEAPLASWFKIARSATWTSIVDVRSAYRNADPVGRFTVFNIKGNAYRLIAEIYYANQVVLIRHIMTHAEYDKGNWK